MALRRLGRSGLPVSEFALGTMTFGMRKWGCDETTATGLVRRYLDADGNFRDTILSSATEGYSPIRTG